LSDFQVAQNNGGAEQGEAAGATNNVALAGARTRLPLTAYEFLRNRSLNAIGFYKHPEGRKPQFNRNQFGFTLGGPIVKQRAFFFLDYEGFRQVRGILATSTIATPAMRSGILSADVFNPLTGVLYPKGTQIPA